MAGAHSKRHPLRECEPDQNHCGDFAEQLEISRLRPRMPLWRSEDAPRRMLPYKAEEWKVIGHAPKIKMMKEHGRHLRLDDEAERKLTMGSLACNWRPRTQ